MRGAEVPSSGLPLRARAPGKAILFGEHAVVHGRTAVVLAIDRWTDVDLRPAAGHAPTSLNGSSASGEAHAYLQAALRRLPPATAVAVHVRSELPSASGLGSSAAFTSALVTGLLALRGGAPRSELARESFLAEREAQGLGSPVDTSASVAGGVLAVGRDPPGSFLWEQAGEPGAPGWKVASLPDPGWTWVVGYTGVAKETSTLVRKVGERLRRPDGPDLLAAIGALSAEGVRALAAGDRAKVGELMGENQKLLRDLGTSHPRLEDLLAAVRGHAVGAKITGAGGGGSILALPPEGQEVSVGRAVSRAGGVPFLVRVAPHGAGLAPFPTVTPPVR